MMRRKSEYVWKFLRDNDCAGADNVTSGMLCTICGKVLVNAHCARCGCRFCEECVTQYLDGEMKFCPGNRDDCQDELMDINTTVLPDYSMNQDILGLVVKCPQLACQFKGELRNMADHERVCEKRPVNCPYCNIGCQESRLINDKINVHLIRANEAHAILLMECVGSLQNEIGSMKRDIARLAEEKQRIVESQAEQIARLDREMSAMKDENQSMKQQIVSLQSEIETNRTDYLSSLEASIDQQLSEEVRARAESQIVEIMEKVRENWLQQEGISSEHEPQTKEKRLKDFDEKRSESPASGKSVAMKIPENWLSVENRQRGEFVWRINQWTARRRATQDRSSDRVVFSDTFCLYEQGYRMCLSLWPAGVGSDNDLHIDWHLTRGPFDEHLLWPFKGAVTLSVINQHTRVDYDAFTMASRDYPDSDRWRKPTSERNYVYYPKKVIDVEELSRNPAVCRDDRILIKCVVEMAR